MEKESVLRLKEGETIYYAVGKTEYNYYDMGMVPYGGPVDDILEKLRFLFALCEIFSSSFNREEVQEKLRKVLPDTLIADLHKYFSKFGMYAFTHFNMLSCNILHEGYLDFSSYEIDKKTKELIFSGKEEEIKLFVPWPYENVYYYDEDGEEVDPEEILKGTARPIYFRIDYGLEFIFMSDEQMKKNETELNEYLDEILAIFKKNNFPVTNYEELDEIYCKISV